MYLPAATNKIQDLLSWPYNPLGSYYLSFNEDVWGGVNKRFHNPLPHSAPDAQQQHAHMIILLIQVGLERCAFWGVEMCQNWGVEMCRDEVIYNR